MFRKSLYRGAHLPWPWQDMCPMSGPGSILHVMRIGLGTRKVHRGKFLDACRMMFWGSSQPMSNVCVCAPVDSPEILQGKGFTNKAVQGEQPVVSAPTPSRKVNLILPCPGSHVFLYSMEESMCP